MTREDAQAFTDALYALGVVFDTTLTPTRMELYFRALEDLPIESIQSAAHRAIKERIFFPKPADLRALAQHSVTLEAETAWLTLIETFQRDCNGYEFPEPINPITRALISVYWGTMARAWEWWRNVHELGLDRKHTEFVERYQDYWHRPLHERPGLPGGRIFRELEARRAENHRRLASDDPRRAAALQLPGLRDTLGERSPRESNPVPRDPPASGPAPGESASASGSGG